jgi:hypothetical protein
MKTKILKFTALVALFFTVITTSNALPPVCSITLVDPGYTTYSDYYGHLECWWMNGGIPQKVGGDITFFGLNLNSLNPVQLDWGLPVETDNNVYIIRAYGYSSVNGAASSNPSYSAWFNNYYYNNDIISVTIRF